MKDRTSFIAGAGLLALTVVAVIAYRAVSTADGATRVSLGSSPAPTEITHPIEPIADVARSPIPLDHAEPIPVTVYQDPLCGCCGAWVEHIVLHGFEPEVQYRNDLAEVKRTFGVRPELSSCHTAVVNGYVIEGHVPGEVMRRFLAEAPAARGLAVPGMPIGSPGMEVPDGRVYPYDVILFTLSGEARVYSSHGPSAAGG